MDHSRWRKLIKECLTIRTGVSGRVYFLVPAHLGSPTKRAVKWLCGLSSGTSLQYSMWDQRIRSFTGNDN